MVQILPSIPTFGEIVGGNLGAGIGTGLGNIPRQLRERKEQQAQNEFARQLGLELGDMGNPDLRKLAIKSGLDRQQQAEQLMGTSRSEEESFNQIKEAFGEKFANVWRASPVGARTALEQAAIQQGLRKLPIGGLFGEETEETTQRTSRRPGEPKSKSIRTPAGEEFALPDIELPPEMNPAEKNKYLSSLRKENSPIFEESKNKAKGLKGEAARLGVLKDLSSKVPDGLGRLFISKEGNIRPFAQVLKLVPPEAERFVKTVNDFITTAKDIFGARVTNYDLQIFKQRLPSLINSSGGREQIIRQMELFNEIESNYYNTLNQVYKNYGLGNISQEEAEQLAEQIAGPTEQQLRQEFENISAEMSSSPEESSESAVVMMLDPQGNPLQVPRDEVERLMNLGATLAE